VGTFRAGWRPGDLRVSESVAIREGLAEKQISSVVVPHAGRHGCPNEEPDHAQAHRHQQGDE